MSTACSGPAPSQARSAPPPCTRTAPHEHVPSPQRRAGGGARRTSPQLLFPSPASFFPPSGGCSELGQKPQCGWLRGQLLPALLLNSRRGIPRGKGPSCPWFAAVPGQMAAAASRRPPRMPGEKGQRGLLPFPRSRAWVRGHAPVLACVPAGRPGRARLPARAGAVGPAARPPGSTAARRVKGKRLGKDRVPDERGPRGRG
jgi:hypothetical protein